MDRAWQDARAHGWSRAPVVETDGLGHMLVTAARTFQAVDMFVPLITISLLGLILNGLLQGLRSYLLRGFPEV